MWNGYVIAQVILIDEEGRVPRGFTGLATAEEPDLMLQALVGLRGRQPARSPKSEVRRRLGAFPAFRLLRRPQLNGQTVGVLAAALTDLGTVGEQCHLVAVDL